MNNNIPFLFQSRDSSAIQKQRNICAISIHHKQIRVIVVHMLFIDPRQHVSLEVHLLDYRGCIC